MNRPRVGAHRMLVQAGADASDRGYVVKMVVPE